MSLNDIILNQQQMEDLFKQHLYQIEAQSNDAEESSLRVKGEMHAGILWLIYQEDTAFLNEADTTLLHKILQACQLTPDQIGLVNYYNQTQSIDEISEKLNAKSVIITGVPIQKNSFSDLPLYEVAEKNSRKIMCTDSFGTIGTDKNLKVRLWNGLRQIFNI
jgi:hypothetical protein